MPFAPVCLSEDAPYLFKDYNPLDKNLEYMTTCYTCTDLMLNICPAVVHVDGTARPQVIDKNHPLTLYFKILERCKTYYGLKALVNTSFNNHEEPIVATQVDALKSLEKNNCDCVVMDNLMFYEIE